MVKFAQRLAPFAIIAAAALLLLYMPDIAPERFADLASYFRVERSRQAFVGYIVAVVVDGSVIYVDGFGEDAAGDKLSADSRLVIGPAGSSFAGMASFSLVRERRLGLDRTVSSYLPWFGFADGTGGDLTVRHLIAQASGAAAGSFDDIHRAAPNLEAAARSLQFATLGATPGTRIEPFQTTSQLLGLILEKASGSSYADLVADRVFKPLGMKMTSAKSADVADAAPPGSSSFFGTTLPRPKRVPAFGAPSGTVVTTAYDLGSFLAFLAAPEKVKKPPLPPRTIATLFEPLVPNLPAGYGWTISGEGKSPAYLHDGAPSKSYDGHSGILILWPGTRSGIAIVAPQHTYLQAALTLPALAEGARRIVQEGAVPRLFPMGRLNILLAVCAFVHIFVLIVQTSGALHWAKTVEGKAEARGTRALLGLNAARLALGILLRGVLIAFLPLAVGRFLGFQLSWNSAFLLQPDIAAWAATALFFALVRNVARLAWLRLGTLLRKRGR